MALGIKLPLAPMEALSVASVPQGPEWQYEPKWDGFRCIAARDGRSVQLQSKALRPLTRYFPELESTLRNLKAKRFVFDGEIAVPTGRSFSFDALLQRIHPAVSRIQRLSTETPTILVVFDLLADENGKSLLSCPLTQRRQKLEVFAKSYFPKAGRIRLSPATTTLRVAQRWLSNTGGTLDGIIAKRRDLPYEAGERSAMQKIKNFRTADCVVGGFRYAANKDVIGSLLLGLYDTEGLLHHVGFTSSIPDAERPALTKMLEKLVAAPGFTGNAPGGPSRWRQGKEKEWKPLRPRLVVEVCYDHVSGDRFRHGTRLVRWRPDKAPRQCKMDQLKQQSTHALKLAS
jgi:ATP-dependent DNA ligase